MPSASWQRERPKRRALDIGGRTAEGTETFSDGEAMSQQDPAGHRSHEPVGDARERIREVERNRPPNDRAGHDAHSGAVETVREDHYRGHHIVVRTTYRVEVDGRPVTGHIGVGNDGRVHYHPIPNVSFASAIDVVRQLIDAFPDEFGEAAADDGHGGHEH